MKASRLSVDIRQVFVVPIEVATGVEPSLHARVRVGAHLEPPVRHKTQIQCLHNLPASQNVQFQFRNAKQRTIF